MKGKTAELANVLRRPREIISYVHEMDRILSDRIYDYDGGFEVRLKIFHVTMAKIFRLFNIPIDITLDGHIFEDGFLICGGPAVEISDFNKLGWEYLDIPYWSNGLICLDNGLDNIPEAKQELMPVFTDIIQDGPIFCDQLYRACIIYHPNILKLREIAGTSDEMLEAVIEECLDYMPYMVYQRCYSAREIGHGMFIPLFLYGSEDYECSVEERHFCIGRMLDAFILSAIYNVFFDENGNRKR